MERRVTLVQVAERAGVSKSTAGYVLSGQDQKMRITEVTRDKVLRIAAEMNYRPNLMARSLRTVVSRPVAIISDTLVTEPYGGELIRGCLAGAAHSGRLTFIGETRRDPKLEAALVDEFLNEQVTDFVFATVYPREIRVPRQLNAARVVLLNCAASRDSVAAVLPDEVEAGRTAAQVLLKAGIQEGIHLVGDRAPHTYAPGRDRERGMREALRAAGLDLVGALDSAWEPESAYAAVTSALDDIYVKRPRPQSTTRPAGDLTDEVTAASGTTSRERFPTWSPGRQDRLVAGTPQPTAFTAERSTPCEPTAPVSTT